MFEKEWKNVWSLSTNLYLNPSLKQYLFIYIFGSFTSARNTFIEIASARTNRIIMQLINTHSISSKNISPLFNIIQIIYECRIFLLRNWLSWCCSWLQIKMKLQIMITHFPTPPQIFIFDCWFAKLQNYKTIWSTNKENVK